jgi:ATP-dependent DNA ligase
MKFKEFIYFYPERPVLVHRDQPLVDEISEDDNYIAEPKYNGARCVLVVLNGDVSLWNRHGNPMRTINETDERYKELVKEVKKYVPKTGHYQFEGEFRHNKVTGLQYKLVLWDCLIYADEYLNKLAYDDRREIVLKHFAVPVDTSKKVIDLESYRKHITVIEQFKTDFKKVYSEFMSGKRKLNDGENWLAEFEGLVMKNRKGKLALGRKTNPDSRWMYKIRKETGRHKF